VDPGGRRSVARSREGDEVGRQMQLMRRSGVVNADRGARANAMIDRVARKGPRGEGDGRHLSGQRAPFWNVAPLEATHLLK
jgi:hypothetical protein